MKARPILFSAPMIRALLEGRKTQTRRIVKPQPSNFNGGIHPANTPKHPAPYFDAYCGDRKTEANPRGMGKFWCWWTEDDRQGPDWIKCPYGKPGDFLWVRETFATDGMGGVRYYATDHVHELRKKKPSIHMPKWASRLTLGITGIRAERLQDISEQDAIAEGCFFTDYGRRCYHHGNNGYENTALCPAPDEDHPKHPGWMWRETTSHQQCMNTAKGAYGNLWNTINGADSWASNPFVWVLEFEVHNRNVRELLKEMEP